MLTRQEPEIPHPITERDFILASECLHTLPGAKVNARPPEIEAFFHLQPLICRDPCDDLILHDLVADRLHSLSNHSNRFAGRNMT